MSSPNSYHGKNFTGIARHVRDLAADIHANIQQWNTLHLQGITCIKTITQEKQAKNYYSRTLQDLCDNLESICDSLVNIFFKYFYIALFNILYGSFHKYVN